MLLLGHRSDVVIVAICCSKACLVAEGVVYGAKVLVGAWCHSCEYLLRLELCLLRLIVASAKCLGRVILESLGRLLLKVAHVLPHTHLLRLLGRELGALDLVAHVLVVLDVETFVKLLKELTQCALLRCLGRSAAHSLQGHGSCSATRADWG